MTTETVETGQTECPVREQLRAYVIARAAALFRLRGEISVDWTRNEGHFPHGLVADLQAARASYWRAVETLESHVKEHDCDRCNRDNP